MVRCWIPPGNFTRNGAFCLNFTVSKKGALLVGCWLTGFAAVAGFLFWLLFGLLWGMGVFLLLTALSFCFGELHRRGYRVRITERELSIERGFFYRILQRIPRRCITGVSCFSSPLGRRLGVCAVVIHSTCLSTPIIGLTIADSERLRGALSLEGSSE